MMKNNQKNDLAGDVVDVAAAISRHDEYLKLKAKKILSKRYLAKPKLTSRYGEKYFKTLGETANYLNKYTGYNLKSDDWKMVGKILYRGNLKRHGYKYKKYSVESRKYNVS